MVCTTTTGTALVLADGAGGIGGGDTAADLACSLASEGLASSPTQTPSALLHEVDTRLAKDANAGETTLVLARIVDGSVSGASVGDSEAWLIATDHDIDLTAGQIRKPLVGSGRALTSAFNAEIGESTLLVASDGLMKYATRTCLCTTVREATDLETAAENLVRAVRLSSGELQDDVSVLLVRRGP